MWFTFLTERNQSMPRESPFRIHLTADEQLALQHIAQKYTLPYFQVTRAKIILFAAEGVANKDIAEYLRVPREIVSKWRKRFFEHRLTGLQDRPRPGRPPIFSPSDSHGGQSAGV
jgi:CRP-like cAMP-binding protein